MRALWLVRTVACTALAITAATAAPALEPAASVPTLSTDAAGVLPVPAAQQLAAALLEDVRQARWQAVFDKMERRFHRETSLEELTNSLVTITEFYGQPVSFTYKAKETGERHYPDGEVKAFEKFWFAMPTSKHPEGVFAFVVVVPDGDSPRAAVISMVNFPGEDRPAILR